MQVSISRHTKTYHNLIQVERLKPKTRTMPKANKEVHQRDTDFLSVRWRMERRFGGLLQSEPLLPNDTAGLLLGICSRELKTYIHTKIYVQMFIAAVFITVKTWKRPRCPFIRKRINRRSPAVNYYSDDKGMSDHAMEIRRNLKNILLSERGQSGKPCSALFQW